MCPRSIVGVPSSQALPGYLITAHHLFCVPAVIGALALWKTPHTQKKLSQCLRSKDFRGLYHKKEKRKKERQSSFCRASCGAEACEGSAPQNTLRRALQKMTAETAFQRKVHSQALI